MNKYKAVNGSYLTRALAISFVVMNHSSSTNFGGGMNFLLLLAGYNFANFSFSKSTLGVNKDLLKMNLTILIPSYVIVVLSAIYSGKYFWQELLLVSNLFKTGAEKVALVPLWYCQILMQMSIFLAFVFWVTNFSKWNKQHPIFISSLFLAFGLILNLISGGHFPWEQLPHHHLWNFFLGWLLFAILTEKTFARKVFASVVAIGAIYLMMGLTIGQHDWLKNRIVIFVALSLLFIWVDKVYLPKPLSVLLHLIAKATFTIFLCHFTMMYIVEYTFSLDRRFIAQGALTACLTIFSCVTIWVLYHSTIKTHKRLSSS